MTLRQENSGLKKTGYAQSSHASLVNTPHTLLHRDSTLSRSVSSPEMDAKILKLQEELSVSYKRNADNSQRMVDIQREMKETQEENVKREAEYATVSGAMSGVMSRVMSRVMREG